MRKNNIKVIAGMLAVILSLGGCGNAGQSSAPAVGTGKPKELIYASSDYTSINPAIYEHGEINSLIFTGLTGHNEKNEVVAGLAEKWEFDDKSNTYTFHLREGVKFQDGELFTAEDVKFTLETIMKPENASEIASNYEDITGISVIDPKTISISLKAPNIAMLDYLTIGVLPKHLLEGKDIWTDEWNRKPIGTGPYTLTAWDKGQSITLERNEYFYGNVPKIDKILFKIVGDSNARALQLKSGEVDLAQVSPKDAKQFEGDDAYFVYVMNTADYRGILYNFNHEFFKNNRGLVNAMSYGIDRQAIIDSVLLGQGEIAYSPLQMGPYNNPDIKRYEYNPERAQTEIEKYGWTKGTDGFYEKEGKKLGFTIHCMEGDQVRVDMAAICAQQLQAIGIQVKVEVNAEIDWANQEAFLIGWGSPFDPDDHTYKVFGTEKGSNFSGYSNEKVDQLLQQARESDKKEERAALYQEFQEVLSEDLPYTFLSYVNAIYVGKKGITGVTEDTVLGHHGVGIFWNIADWDINTEG